MGTVSERLDDFRITMLLADAAQVVDGKLYVLGGGWSVTGPQPTPSALAVLIQVPWGETNRPHQLRLELVGAGGEPVMLPTGPDSAPQPLVIETKLEVGRPAGIRPGSRLSVPLAFGLFPLPLTPGERYLWRLTLDGAGHPEWQVEFDLRPAQGR